MLAPKIIFYLATIFAHMREATIPPVAQEIKKQGPQTSAPKKAPQQSRTWQAVHSATMKKPFFGGSHIQQETKHYCVSNGFQPYTIRAATKNLTILRTLPHLSTYVPGAQTLSTLLFFALTAEQSKPLSQSHGEYTAWTNAPASISQEHSKENSRMEVYRIKKQAPDEDASPLHYRQKKALTNNYDSIERSPITKIIDSCTRLSGDQDNNYIRARVIYHTMKANNLTGEEPELEKYQEAIQRAHEIVSQSDQNHANNGEEITRQSPIKNTIVQETDPAKIMASLANPNKINF